MYFNVKEEPLLNAIYNFSCVNVSKMPGGGLQLQRKHVAVNKLINTGFVLD
jgi:hypothetical protein